MRGRGNSGGRFDPFVNEGQDGYDAVEWLARQPWSNGKVAMWGGSYAGYDQWATRREAPPHLATIVPVASPYPGVDFPMTQNIFAPYDMQWLTYTSGLAANRNLFGEGSFWIQKNREMYRGHRPFRELDRIVGNTSTVFQTWVAHPTVDAYWKAMPATPEQTAAMIDLPILTITGYLRRRPGGRPDLVPRAHARRQPGGAGEALPGDRPLGPRRHAHAPPRRSAAWPSATRACSISTTCTGSGTTGR